MSNKLGLELYVPDAPMRLMAQVIADSYNLSINDPYHVDGQMFCVAEEAGEMVGAFRRYTNRARRSGTREALLGEIADVHISMAHAGWLIGINDIQEVIDSKLETVYSRGWKE